MILKVKQVRMVIQTRAITDHYKYPDWPEI